MCISDSHEYLQDKINNKLESEVCNPTHYTQGSIQPIEYIIANNLDFCAGNIVKYVTRYKYKNGIKDLEKAKFYIERILEEERKKSNNTISSKTLIKKPFNNNSFLTI